MSTITLPNIRVSSDLTIRLKLKDGGVAIDWSTLQNIRVSLYADDQRSMASRCNVSIDDEDSTILVCQYAANKMQYLGVNRVIVQCKYLGEVKTYDKPAFTFVRWTSDQEGEQITIDDPDVDVEISVEDVSSSILQEAVDAAFSAADRANDAAAAAEHMVDIHTGPEGKSAYEVAVEEGYTGTEEEWLASLKGPVGETPDISIGTVTTVEPGTPAAASMTGTPEAPVLNLSIPKGAVGATPNFTVGTVTTGQPGTPVVITITGTAEAPVLNVTIPQGLKGDTGVSADYPITIHNGLDSDATDEALAAAQGKILDGKVSQLEAKVTDIAIPSVVNKSVTTGSTIGATLTLAYNNESGYRCAIYDCSPGDVFIVNGKGGNSTRLWGFVDADNKLLAVSAGGATGNNTRVVAPANAVKFIWNSSISATSYYEQKDSLPYLEERVSEVETETARHSEQLVFKNYTDGKSTSSGGTISDYTGRLITDKIPCTAGETVYFDGAVQYVLAYDSSGAFLASRSFNYLFWTLPTDTAYIIVCFPSTLDDATVYKNNSIVWKKTLGPDTLLGIQNEINPQGERISSVETGVSDSIGQLFEEYTIPFVGGRTYNVESNGKLGSSTSYLHRCVKVSPGDVLTFKNTDMNRDLYVAFLSSYTYTISAGAHLPLVSGTSCKPICLKGSNGGRILSEVSYVVPEGCVSCAFGQYSNVSPKVTLRIEKANPIPNYYRQYITDKSFAVRKRDIQLGQNADSFIFFTDYHIDFPLLGGITTNFQHSPALIDYVREHTNTKKILFGGDVFNSPSNDTERFELMDAFLNQFKFAPDMITAVGNHEWRQSSDLSNDGRTYDFGSLAKTLEGIVTFGRDANGDITQPYYYFDNPSLKVRYFVLYTPGTVENSSYAVFNYTEQLAFVESETANLDASWKVVIVQHIVYENGSGGSSVYDADNFPTKLGITAVGTAIKSAIVTHNQTAQAKIVGLFCGHTHNEFLEFVDGHCVAVCQNCDATFTRYNGNNDVVFPNQTVRNYGTTDEQSFDIYHIDLENKVLYDIKVGYGADKVVNITEQSVGVGNTITLSPSITPDSWVSQDESIATVANGVVTGVSAGRVTIKARETGTPNGKWEYFNIIVS